MPSINKFRIANVNFKNNSRRYDDIVIPVNDRHCIIEGENGDGKTLLTQVLFQTISPNSYFHPANRISRLFEDNDNTTIHSMIEWELDKGNEYDFLITGFSAKDIKKENEEFKLTFDYFNYVILYKHDLNFSVESIPLKTEKNGKISRMGYKQLKDFLKKLGDNEKRCFVKTFSSKKEYLNFIYNYGINETEWKLIFDTNAQEGGAENYFTSEFKKPKDLITKKIVPIIESINRYRLDDEMSNEELAKSLLNINKTIKQLTEKTQRLSELNVVDDCLSRIIELNNDMKRNLEDKDATFIDIIKGYNRELLTIKEISDKIAEIETFKDELEYECDSIKEIKGHIREEVALKEDERESLEVDLKEVDKLEKILNNRAKKDSLLKDVVNLQEQVEVVLVEIEKIETAKANISSKIEDLKRLEVEKRAENLYLEYRNISQSIKEKQLKLENFNRSNDELLAKKREFESMYLYSLNRLEDTLKDTLNSLDLELNNTKENIDKTLKSLVESKTLLNNLDSNISFNENEINRTKKDILECSNKIERINTENDVLISNNLSLTNTIKIGSSNKVVGYVEQLEKDIKLKNITPENNTVIDSILMELQNTSNEIAVSIGNLKEKRISLQNDTLKNELESKISKTQDEIKQKFVEEKELSKEISELKAAKKSNDYKVDSIIKDLEEYKNSLSSISNILNEVDTENRFECEIKLSNEVSTLKNELFSLDRKIADLDSKLVDLNNNEGLSLSEELLRNFDIISNVYASALLGRDFIKELSMNEKDFYLSKTTLIPYGVILNEQDYESLLKNKTIQDRMGDSLTPIINLAAIKNVDKLDESTIYFNTLSKDVFIDEDRILEEIKKVELEISKQRKIYSDINEELLIKENNLKSISVLNAKYSSDYEELQARKVTEYKKCNNSIKENISIKEESLLALENESKELELMIEGIREQISKHENYLKLELSNVNKLIDNLQEDNINNNAKIDILDKIKNKLNLYNSNNKQMLELNSKIEEFNNIILESYKSIEAFTLEIKDVKVKISSLESQNIELNELQKETENKKAENIVKLKEISSYKTEIPHNTKEKETDISADELRKQVKIFNRNYEKEYSQLEELESEIKDAYKNSSRKKLDIESLNVSFGELEDKSDTLIYNSIDVFNSINKRIEAANLEMDNIVELANDSTKRKIELETTIKNKYSDVNKINTYEDIVIEDGYNAQERRVEIKDLINTNKLDKKKLDIEFSEYTNKEYELRKQIDDLSKELNKKQNELRKNESEKDNIEVLISLNNIDKNITDEVADNTNFVIKEASKKIDWHNHKIENIKIRHRRDIEETSKKLENSVFEFVSVLKHILPPNTIDEVIAQNKSIFSDEGYLYYLNQEKESLNKELDDLSLIKQEFITKCVRNVEFLIDKLKKLSKQSTVVLNNKKIKLLELKLHELNSEQKVEKMTNHINRLLDDIDDKAEENPEECIKLLNNELTASKLLEQGIKNINNCEINVYIPDSVDIENGYYERWGGGASGGQRSTMYFTVLMALIIFIRESSSLNGAIADTKVIYGDGPFRGAAALYLWEPIFKMMQENNIQFIVTNYKTPAHLTNMFSSRVLLTGVETQLNGKKIIQNEISMESVFKENAKSLRGENILVKYEDYKIPVVRKVAEKEAEDDSSQISLYDLI